ncbi:MAG: hypothetical protein H0T15_05985 [Thermoleophilaceae bacterium]|nr:hypothetical protein [Thermoleophilaceae bacterium]
MTPYGLTIRAAGKTVRRERFDSLDAAMTALEFHAREIGAEPPAKTVSAPLMRDFDSVAQVRARLELSGPRRLRAGLDVRGDGSAEAFTGRLRRNLLEQRAGETPWAALRRSIG